jgi:hypothetical protein
MKPNALNIVAILLLSPTVLALFFTWEAKEQVDYDLALVVWVWFALPGLALSALLFWLGRSDLPRRDRDRSSSNG